MQNVAPAAGSLVTVVAFSLSLSFTFLYVIWCPSCSLQLQLHLCLGHLYIISMSVHEKHVVHFERRCFYLDLHHSTDASYHTLPYYFKIKWSFFFLCFFRLKIRVHLKSTCYFSLFESLKNIVFLEEQLTSLKE